MVNLFAVNLTKNVYGQMLIAGLTRNCLWQISENPVVLNAGCVIFSLGRIEILGVLKTRIVEKHGVLMAVFVIFR